MNNILLVTQNNDIKVILTGYLRDIYCIDVAVNTSEAINKALQKNYDLIIIEFGPGGNINGLEIVDKLKSHEQFKSIPFVAMTAYCIYNFYMEISEHNISDFLEIPFDKRTLVSIIENNLNLDLNRHNYSN